MIQLVQVLKHVKNTGRWSTWDLSRRNASDPTNSHWPKNCEVMRVLPRAQATGARDEDLTTQCIDHLSNITSLEEIWIIHIYPMFPISVKHPYFFHKIKVVVEPGNTKKVGDVSDVSWWRRIFTLFFQLPVVLVQVFQVQETNGVPGPKVQSRFRN